jgi:protein-L-isoaspartate(D-aspartate) O-methyltransferase
MQHIATVVSAAMVVLTTADCKPRRNEAPEASTRITAGTTGAPANVPGDSPEARARRDALVSSLEPVVRSEHVLEAMRRVPRHLFAPNLPLARAYDDSPQPIGHDQTISQPSVVAIMTEALELRGGERVLEIGTGSGYQAAVLSVLANEVRSIEIVPELGEAARKRLTDLGYANVYVRIGDGYRGWPEHAPFDRILLTAAPDEIPKALLDQLAEGGVLVAPVGVQAAFAQRLIRVRKSGGRLSTEDLGAVKFVPMVR